MRLCYIGIGVIITSVVFMWWSVTGELDKMLPVGMAAGALCCYIGLCNEKMQPWWSK